MTRSERFDAAFFVDVPSPESRRKMLDRWLTNNLDDCATVSAELAEQTEKFSGADLRSVVKQAMANAKQRRKPLTMDLLRPEVERKRMRAIALYDEFQQLRRWGRMYCDPAGPTDI